MLFVIKLDGVLFAGVIRATTNTPRVAVYFESNTVTWRVHSLQCIVIRFLYLMQYGNVTWAKLLYV